MYLFASLIVSFIVCFGVFLRNNNVTTKNEASPAMFRIRLTLLIMKVVQKKTEYSIPNGDKDDVISRLRLK